MVPERADIKIQPYSHSIYSGRLIRVYSCPSVSAVLIAQVEIFGEDGFDAVFLTGEELAPRQAILGSILREGVDAEQIVKGS